MTNESRPMLRPGVSLRTVGLATEHRPAGCVATGTVSLRSTREQPLSVGCEGPSALPTAHPRPRAPALGGRGSVSQAKSEPLLHEQRARGGCATHSKRDIAGRTLAQLQPGGLRSAGRGEKAAAK